MILVRHLLLQHLGLRYCHPLVAIGRYYFDLVAIILLITAQHSIIVATLIEPLVAHLVMSKPEKQQWHFVLQHLHPRHQLQTGSLRPFPRSCHMQNKPQQLCVLGIQEM